MDGRHRFSCGARRNEVALDVDLGTRRFMRYVPFAIDHATNVNVVMNGKCGGTGLASQARLMIYLRVHRETLLRVHDLSALYAALTLMLIATHRRWPPSGRCRCGTRDANQLI